MVQKNTGVSICSTTSEILARPRCDVPTEGHGFVDYFTEQTVLGGFNSHKLVYFGFVCLCFLDWTHQIEDSFATNQLTHTTEETHIKLKQPAIKHAADSGGLTQALSGKRCRIQILWHCCSMRITQPEEETPQQQRSVFHYSDERELLI